MYQPCSPACHNAALLPNIPSMCACACSSCAYPLRCLLTNVQSGNSRHDTTLSIYISATLDRGVCPDPVSRLSFCLTCILLWVIFNKLRASFSDSQSVLSRTMREYHGFSCKSTLNRFRLVSHVLTMGPSSRVVTFFLSELASKCNLYTMLV